MSTQKIAASASRQINAVVVSAGLMQKTVKVRIGQQKWHNHIRKHFNRPKTLLVHDPASSLRIGDIISISPGWRASKHVHHVVNSILAPFGDSIEERPPIPSEEERLAMRAEKRAKKEERRQLASGFVADEWNVERVEKRLQRVEKLTGWLHRDVEEFKGGDSVEGGEAVREGEVRTL